VDRTAINKWISSGFPGVYAIFRFAQYLDSLLSCHIIESTERMALRKASTGHAETFLIRPGDLISRLRF
jgi:hypothetical protein